ncbi:Polyphenol oxidase [Austwickia sp. TVS 96-490-7B]|nr:Polyphenol oxidase [Austwickia sp. TVS 96-490-7B]
MWGFTDRHGGVSSSPYDGFNLGDHVGDDPQLVQENRSLLAAELGLAATALRFMNQVHGAEVVQVGVSSQATKPADGMVTVDPDVALVVMVADCVPVVLCDPQAGVIGVAHAGRPGLVAGVVPAVVAAMRDLGARELSAAVGPSVCGRCYEVPESLREQVSAVVPVSRAVSWSGTPAVDVAAGVVDQLISAGVCVQWRPGCTRESAELFSYRRHGRTGRQAGVVVSGVER